MYDGFWTYFLIHVKFSQTRTQMTREKRESRAKRLKKMGGTEEQRD